MGPNVLWLTEFLGQAMELQPGMRVLDMGCGRALSSIFLAKEFGVQVWAADLWIAADVLPQLAPLWPWEFCSFHGPEWWRTHWAKTGLVEILTADSMPNGWEIWLRWEEMWEKIGAPTKLSNQDVLRGDTEHLLGFTRVVARRRSNPLYRT